VLQHYDVGDLLVAIGPRPVTLVNPAGALGQPVRDSVVRQYLASDRIRLVHRGFRDPLAIE
jgi:hypothetical protein